MSPGPGAEGTGDVEQHAVPTSSADAPGATPPPTYPPISPAGLQAFCDRLGHRFADPDLLGQALTHRSWCAEHAGYRSNERLEFLGDSVLGLVVTDDLYALLPDAGEGQLSRMRAAVVCSAALAEMAAELSVGTGVSAAAVAAVAAAAAVAAWSGSAAPVSSSSSCSRGSPDRTRSSCWDRSRPSSRVAAPRRRISSTTSSRARPKA